MKTLQELKEERKALNERNQAIYAAVEAEGRAITDEELAEVQSNIVKRARLADEISDLMVELGQEPKQSRSNSFDYAKAILEARNSVNKTFELGEQRAIMTATSGAGAIATDVYTIMDAIRDNMVLTQAGATMLTGLKGDLKLPKLGATTAQWEGENDDAADGATAPTSVTMSPKRLSCYVDLSNKLLEQSSQDINALIQRDIVNAISQALQSTVLGGAAGSTTQPAGIFHGAGAASALTFANIVDLETTVAAANSLADGACYIMHPKAYGKCKTTAKATNTGLGMIADGEMANGYKVLRTAGVYTKDESGTPTFGVAFGNFAELFIGTWGNISVTVDPYTQATKGVTRLVINAYVDAVVRNSNAIATTMIK